MPRVHNHTAAHIRRQKVPMRKITLEFAAAIALTLGAIIASAGGVLASDVMVMNAFARASATPVAKSGAVYVTLMNHGAEADRLLSLSSPAARMAELHVTRMDGDVMKMEAAGIIDLPPNATVEMKPGGLHVMLVGLTAPLREGESVDLVLHFEKAGDVTVSVPVGAAAAGGHDHTD